MCARRSNIYTVDRQPSHVQMATTTLRQSLWRLEPKGLELKVNQAGRRVYRRLKSHRHRTLRTDIHTNRSWAEVVKFCTSEKDSNMPTVTSPFFLVPQSYVAVIAARSRVASNLLWAHSRVEASITSPTSPPYVANKGLNFLNLA